MESHYETKKIRVVLVGCGGIANAWLAPVKEFEDVELVGFVDLNIDAARKLAAANGLDAPDFYIGDSLEAAVGATNADAVFDCTVPAAHPSVVCRALALGCHVLGEKPMAEDMESARKMVDAACDSGKVYAVIQNRRYLDSIIRFKSLLSSGEIGNVHTLNADFFLGPHFGGFREEMRHVLLADMAIHSFDQARFLTDADPVSVFCHDWNPPGSWFNHGASAVALFKMSNDLVFCYRGSWCAEGMPTSWQCDWRAVGTSGTAVWDGENVVDAEKRIGETGFFVETQKIDAPPAVNLKYAGHAGLIRDFVDCILYDAPPPQTICTDNIKSLAMVDAAIKSAETGGWVEL